MTPTALTVSQVAAVCGGSLHGPGDVIISDLLIDSRLLVHADGCLFVALVSERNDGHKYIGELAEKGIRAFLVSKIPAPFVTSDSRLATARPPVFIYVPDTLLALQQICAWHRSRFSIPVIGITGSNGKTIVKEWLFQLLSPFLPIIRSPKSYNSQVGVPLSVWKILPEHKLAIFEAGISQPGEMERLEEVIRPTIGIITNIGHAHDEHFNDQRQKVEEKLKLFMHSEMLVYCSDYPLITECLAGRDSFRSLRTFTWSRKGDADLVITCIRREGTSTCIDVAHGSGNFDFSIPFTDDASVENAMNCLATLIALRQMDLQWFPGTGSEILTRFSALAPIAMRLELREAVNRCSLINDSYNSDINSLIIALDFLSQQNQHQRRTVILSDILQSGRDKGDLYKEIAGLLLSRKIGRLIGIGSDMVSFGHLFPMESAFFSSTDEFLALFPVSAFQDETILLKGARPFEFEKIGQLLQQKAHETVMEINLDALIHNLNHFRSGLRPGTRTMAMVKAFSYGSGSFEIANVLQFHHVDYLAVAYADEGVELRRAGIRLPVMVMSPEEQSMETLLKYNLEPEIYNLHILGILEAAVARNVTSIQQEVNIHIKLDTGMHRLGFSDDELPALVDRLKACPGIRIQSVFSHLASSEDPADDEFTQLQINRFKAMTGFIKDALGITPLCHILNSAGISRFPEAQFDMVRLGIGLYGVGAGPDDQGRLRNVSSLRTVVTQVKRIPAGDSIGYNRMARAEREMLVAILPVGYADGLNRRLGNGRGKVWIRGKPAPIVGNVCMDLTIADVTAIPGMEAGEGTEAVIFNDEHPVSELAATLETIPYEILTGISRRVKRIYFYE